MIEKIISFSIKNKFITGLMVVVWTFAGLYSMKEVPIDATPDITNNQVQVITLSSNLGTSDIEQFVTYPIELALGNLPGVEEIRSISRFGLSVITIVFEEGMGTYLPRQLVSEKLNEIQDEIPEGFGSPEIGPISTGLGEIYQYTLEVEPKYRDKYSDTDLRTFQDWIVKRQMSMVKGVVEVNTFGGKVKQYEVAVLPHKLKSMGLNISEVAKALQQNNENTGGAYIEKNHQANFIRGEGLMTSIEDIENTLVKQIDGLPILVKDVAKVKIGEGIRYGAFTANGKDAVGGMVLMLKGANSDKVITRVKERVAKIQQSLPEGIKIKPFLDRSELIAKTTSTIKTNLIEGGLIVIFILIILLGNWRGGLIVATTIPLSLLFAFILMHAFGVWANLMSLGAIDFGIIVDGAVIIVEASVFFMVQQLHSKKKLDTKTKDELALKASKKMMNSAFFGQLIILIVFLPILTLTGIEGKMFRPMALTFIFAMIGAMILCLTYVPMMSAYFLKVKKDEKSKPNVGDKIMNFLHKLYHPMLDLALKHAKIALLFSFLLITSGAFILSTLGGEFMPKIDEGDIAMQALLKPGTALSETITVSKKIENTLLKKFPDEIKEVMARIGVSEIPTDPMPMDIADMFILLKPKSEWTKVESKEELIQKMKEELHVIIGVNYQFSQPLELRFNELMTGVRQDLVIKIYGDNLETLSETAEKIGNLISNIQGVADLQIESTKGLAQMTVKYKRKKLARYGLNIQDINHLISSSFGKERVGVIFEGEKKFDLVVSLDQGAKKGIESLNTLFVNLKNGETIPLREVASIEYIAAPMQISRENTKRKISIGINVRNRDVQSLVAEISETLDKSFRLPVGYSMDFGGSFENLEKAKSRLYIVVPIVLVMIFVLLYFALNSFVQALLIFIAIPLATYGGILSLYLRDMPFSISAGVGFIVLFGVAVLNGLVLITSLNELKSEGISNIKERIKKATHNRLRPIMLTAITDVLGFLPMAISSGAGAEVQRPLATVVIGGLLSATILTLFIIPVIYQFIENKMEEKKKSPSLNLGLNSLVVLFILSSLFLSSTTAFAQKDSETISLEKAIELAKKNYPNMKRAALQIEASKKLRKTAVDLENTRIFTGKSEAGGNSVEETTTNLGISQTLDFPTAFLAKSKWLAEKVKLNQELKNLTENDLVRKVKSSYYDLLYFKSRLELIEQINEIYKDFERVAKIRFETEETSRLAYISASNKYQQVLIARIQAEADVKIAKQNLAQWINIPSEFNIYGSLTEEHSDLIEMKGLKELSNNPTIKYYEKQLDLSDAKKRIVANQFAPQINLQFAWQETSMTKNLYAYRVGISVPIWFKAKRAEFQVSKIQKEVAKQNLEEQKLNLRSEFLVLLAEHEKVRLSLNYYEETALNLAEEQIEASLKSYKEGEIDYIAYIRNLEDALKIKERYLDFLKQNKQLITQLDFQVGNY